MHSYESGPVPFMATDTLPTPAASLAAGVKGGF